MVGFPLPKQTFELFEHSAHATNQITAEHDVLGVLIYVWFIDLRIQLGLFILYGG